MKIKLFLFILVLVYLTITLTMAENYTLENQDIDESSGLAISTKYPDTLWTHNDSGSPSIIYALDFKGKDKGTYFLGGDNPNDWEDMASFKLNGKSYLLLADTGDNKEIQLWGRITVYEEPEIPSRGKVYEPEWAIDFTYPNHKAFDVEAVSVDIINKKIYLLSKRKKKKRLFELPLKPDKLNEVITAKKIKKIKYINRPTAMDISKDGNYAVILEYGRVYWYENMLEKGWNNGLKKPNKTIKYKGLRQPEAISFGVDPYEVYITSETLPARMKKLIISKHK